MVKILYDEIKKELARLEKSGYKFKKVNIHNSLLNKLKKYNCLECCENFYDDEPDYDEDTHNKYMDYCESYMGYGTPLDFYAFASNGDKIISKSSSDNNEIFRFAPEATREECKEAYYKILQQRKDYEDIRLRKCTWQEPYFEGNWDMTQKNVNDIAIGFIKDIKRCSFPKKDRVYLAETDKQICIYIYTRDILQIDYTFVFKKKTTKH